MEFVQLMLLVSSFAKRRGRDSAKDRAEGPADRGSTIGAATWRCASEWGRQPHKRPTAAICQKLLAGSGHLHEVV